MFNTALYKHHYYILNSCRRVGPRIIVIHILQAPFTIPFSSSPQFILLIHFKIQSNGVSACIFPPLLPIPHVMVLISSPRNMKISLPHSPSDFLLPNILCCPYIAAPSPAVILSILSSQRYWDQNSAPPATDGPYFLFCQYHFDSPAIHDGGIVDSTIPAFALPILPLYG